ncbi:MAG: hypothetical protein AAF066_15400 [Pseudomonadota bacterium]
MPSFPIMDGNDLLSEMLEAAASHGAYRSLILTKADVPPSFTPSSCATITAIGPLLPGSPDQMPGTLQVDFLFL